MVYCCHTNCNDFNISDLSNTTDKLGPSVSSIQTQNSPIVFETEPRETRKRSRNGTQNIPPVVKLSKNIPNSSPSNANKLNEHTLAVETKDMSKIRELVKAGLQERMQLQTDMPDQTEVNVSTDKHEMSNLNHKNVVNDNLECDVMDNDEDTDVDYSDEEAEDGEIENAAEELLGEKLGNDFDLTKEDDTPPKEAKVSLEQVDIIV